MSDMRIPKKVKLELDLTVPIENQIEKIPEVTDEDCFGNEWDLSTSECRECADKETCGILFKKINKKRADALEAKRGTTYLDKQDLDIDWKYQIGKFDGGKITDLIQECADRAHTSDVKAVTEHLKREIKAGVFKVESGIVKLL